MKKIRKARPKLERGQVLLTILSENWKHLLEKIVVAMVEYSMRVWHILLERSV